MKRREFIRNVGATAAGIAIAPGLLASESRDVFNPDTDVPGDLNELDLNVRDLHADIRKPITAVVLGVGNRGTVYGNYAAKFPDTIKFVGLSDINKVRSDIFSRKHGIPAERCYGDFHEILAVPKFADAMVISLPDGLHYEAAMKALELGYDVLLEKPMAQSEKECKAILAQSRKYGRIVGVCHVLRYAPYFVALKAMLDRKVIGDVVSIQHMEPIRFAHMAHSYVRGNWHDSKATTPIILAKSCHDLDIIRWMLGKPCRSISAEGGLYLFKKENAPEGAPLRCTDGCPHEPTCPYSAIDIYARKKQHTKVFDNLDVNDFNDVIEHLKNSDYGRCVYHCDNDQPDHYICNMVFEDGVTAAFSMEAFTPVGGRRTRIMGTKGFIDGDMTQFTITDFRTMKRQVWNRKVAEIPEYKGAGHGGGDYALMRDFVEAVSWQDPSRMSSTIEASVESHVMGFRAEKSRLKGKKEKVSL